MAMAAEKNKKHSQNTENGVVITVYVESSRTRSSYKLSKKDLTKKTKPQNESKKTHGFDRKAELLAYSRHLRTIEASQKVHVQSQPRIKASSLFSSIVELYIVLNCSCGRAVNIYIVTNAVDTATTERSKIMILRSKL
jgi:aspartate carbamoyltransferase catalytic subunit